MPGIHWSLKILFAGAGVGILVYLLPIIDLLELCLYVVIVPLTLLSLVGIAGDGALEGAQIWLGDLRQRAEAAKAAMDAEPTGE